MAERHRSSIIRRAVFGIIRGGLRSAELGSRWASGWVPLLRLRRCVSGRGAPRLRRSIETKGRDAPGGGCRTAGRHRDLYAAPADPDKRADLQQFETDGAAARLRKRRVIQPNSAHRTHQHVGHRSKPQPQLICPHGGRRGAIRIEVELALLDAIFHVTARAVDFFVKMLRLALGSLQRGDDEARIGLPGGELRLAHDTPLAAPAVERGPSKILEAARRLAGPPALRLRPRHFTRDLCNQTRILGQSEEKVHVVGLAPRHQLLSRKAAVSPYKNANTRPALADVGDDARHLLYGTVRRVEARYTQLGCQQMPAAEHVQRQVAITVVIAVIEPPLLLAMNPIIGGIKIEDNLTWWPLVSFQKKIHEKTSNRHRIVTDLAVARRLQLAQLQTIER